MKLQKQITLQKINNETDKKQVFQCYELWKDCFGDSKQYMEYYFENKLKDNQIYVMEEEDRVISMLHLNPFRMSLKGREGIYYYIVGVATTEEKRGQGCMRNVLSTALKEQRESGKLFTYLMPAAKEIYLPYDFRYIYTQDRVCGLLHGEAIEPLETVQVKQYCALTECEKQEALCFVMKRLQEDFSLYTVRDQAYYDRLCLEMQAAGGEVVAIYDNGRLLGVCSYMLENGHMEIVETITEKAATRKLANALFSHVEKQKAPNQLHVAWLETNYLDVGKLQKFVTNMECNKQPIIMARLLDAEQALSLMSLRPEEKEEVTICLKVKDSLLAENEKTYKITAATGQTLVEETQQEYEVCMDIATLTEYFFESVPIHELQFQTKRLDREEAIRRLERLSGCKPCYINEIV